MLVQELQWHAFGKQFKRLAVQSESKAACKRDVCGSLPVSCGVLYQLQDPFAFSVEPFHGQGGQPVCTIYLRCGRYGRLAWKAVGSIKQKPVASLCSLGRAFEYCLGYYGAVLASDLGVIFLYNMEYDRFICRIRVMMVAVPVGGLDMYLHVPDPCLPVDHYRRIEKVRAGICVEPPLAHDGQSPPVNGRHSRLYAEAVLPDELHQLLHVIDIRGANGVALRLGRNTSVILYVYQN